LFVFLTGLSYRSAPLAVRETLSIAGDRLPSALATLERHAGRGVILSTCNRTEVYSVVRDAEHGSAAFDGFVSDELGVDPEYLRPHLYALGEHEALTPGLRELLRMGGGPVGDGQLGEPSVAQRLRSQARRLADADHEPALRAKVAERAARQLDACAADGERVAADGRLGACALARPDGAVEEVRQRAAGHAGPARRAEGVTHLSQDLRLADDLRIEARGHSEQVGDGFVLTERIEVWTEVVRIDAELVGDEAVEGGAPVLGVAHDRVDLGPVARREDDAAARVALERRERRWQAVGGDG